MKIGVLIYTYDRTDDARINMEIIRSVWNKTELLKNVKIIHTFNGEKEWWPEKYLEDELLYLPNPGHLEGAEILMNEGVKEFYARYPETQYVIILASDTWLMSPVYIQNIVLEMQRGGKYLATCAWAPGIPILRNSIWKLGMSTDFAVIDLKWSIKNSLFPIRFGSFRDTYREMFFYNGRFPVPENVFSMRFLEGISHSVAMRSQNDLFTVANQYIYRIKDREPVHRFSLKTRNYERRFYWKKMGLLTHHDPAPKQKALRAWQVELGKHGKAFLTAKDLTYYNRGIK